MATELASNRDSNNQSDHNHNQLSPVTFDNATLQREKRRKLADKAISVLKFLIILDLVIELCVFIVNLLLSWSELNFQIANYYKTQEVILILIVITIALIEVYGVYKEIVLIVLITAITWTFGVFVSVYLIIVNNAITTELNLWLIDVPMTLVSVVYLFLIKRKQDAVKKGGQDNDEANYNVNPFAYRNF